jgi:hypothetical protein
VRALRRRPEVGDVVLVVLLLGFITVASSGAGVGLQVIVVDGPTPGNIAVPLAVYSAAAFGTRTQSWQVLGVALVGTVLAGID